MKVIKSKGLYQEKRQRNNMQIAVVRLAKTSGDDFHIAGRLQLFKCEMKKHVSCDFHKRTCYILEFYYTDSGPTCIE